MSSKCLALMQFVCCVVDTELSVTSMLKLAVWDKDGEDREFLGTVDVPMSTVIRLVAEPPGCITIAGVGC